jgi:hypothetical protein
MRRTARLAPHSFAFLLLGVGVGAMVACGGAEATDLFDGPGSSDTDAGGAGGDAASADDSASGGGHKDGGGGKDAGEAQEDASAGDSGRPDVGTVDPSIYCGEGPAGAISCGAAQYCCATPGNSGGGGGVVYDCKANTVSACSGLKISCDDSTDCPASQYCCGTFEQGSGYTKLGCSPNAACGTPTGGTSFLRFCDPTASPDECAAAGKKCGAQSSSLPGYTYCQ